MVHILRNSVADKLVVFIVNFHFIWIFFHESLCPVVHSGHYDPASFSLVHHDSTSIWKSLTCTFLRNRLSAASITNTIVQRYLFNKKIDIFRWNKNLCILIYFFKLSQKGNRFIMPSMIQSHLCFIVCRNNRPCFILIFPDNIRKTGNRTVCYIS